MESRGLINRFLNCDTNTPQSTVEWIFRHYLHFIKRTPACFSHPTFAKRTWLCLFLHINRELQVFFNLVIDSRTALRSHASDEVWCFNLSPSVMNSPPRGVEMFQQTLFNTFRFSLIDVPGKGSVWWHWSYFLTAWCSPMHHTSTSQSHTGFPSYLNFL